MSSATVRRARRGDYEDVAAFTEDTWSDRERGDYVPRVFENWVDADGEDQRTVVVETDGDVVGLCQARLLSAHEAWLQGMRVAPAHRGAGHGKRMVGDLFGWAREHGATVARNLVFGWNDAGMGQSLASGFVPRASFRWARPEPREATPERPVEDDPSAAWSYWARSEARDVLGGLALDAEAAWAVSELTRDGLAALADRERVFAVRADGTSESAWGSERTETSESTGTNGSGGTSGMAARVRTTESESEDGGVERTAVYGVGAWADAEAAAALFSAIRADAHDLGVDATRALIPESPRHVTRAAAVRADPADGPEFVFEADLTGPA